MKWYQVKCCSCEEPFSAELEPGQRSVCLQCNQPLCHDCKLTNPPEWKGLCSFCVPEAVRQGERPMSDHDYWKNFNRNRSDAKARKEQNSAAARRKKQVGG